jgi:hypothetical protein
MVSPQPPSSICFERRNSHALLALELVLTVSPASASDSSANMVAYLWRVSEEQEGGRGGTYVKQIAHEPYQDPSGSWMEWMKYMARVHAILK